MKGNAGDTIVKKIDLSPELVRVALYIRVSGEEQKIKGLSLEAHNCDWKTTDEEYDTTTANGRLYINVKLSIAQNEADIDGERIDVVFDSKIAHGTVVSGSAPFGFRVMRKSGWKLCQKTQPLCKTLSTTLKLRFPSVLLSAISGKPTA